MPQSPKQTKNMSIEHSGASYFIKGFSLIRQKGIRRFVFIPLTINVLLFSFAFYFVYLELNSYMGSIITWLPSWLNWLSIVLW
ncbi:MAG: CysZ protein, partial [Colwellia sp.]